MRRDVEAIEKLATLGTDETTRRPSREPRIHGWPGWLVGLMVFAGSFLFRFLDPYFYNDHFLWISGGRQVLVYGELPFRDFFDPGYFLQHLASAGSQRVFGYNLLGEALLSISLLSAGTAITFMLSSRISRSYAIGLLAAALVVGMYPRLYNYHKVFFLAFGLLVLWRYVDRPTTWNLVLVGLTTAVAFLFRHDNGLYMALPVVVVIVAAHWNDWGRLLRRAALYAASAILPLLPFFVFLELNGGVVAYFSSGAEWALQRRGTVAPWPTFTADASAPLSIFQPANAFVWLYALFITLPFLTLLVLACQHVRWRRVAATPPEAIKILPAAILCAVSAPLLLRTPLEARLADVVAPTAVIGAWLLGQWFGPIRWQETLARSRQPRSGPSPTLLRQVTVASLPTAFRSITAVAIVGITSISVATAGELQERLEESAIFDGPTAVLDRGEEVFDQLRESPPDRELYPGDNELRLARYVRECTQPDDRLLVTSFAPQLYFYSGRAAAGGAIQVDATAEQQAEYLASVPGEPVPVVIAVEEEDGDYFESTFETIEDYLRENYRVALQLDPGDDDPSYRVLVHKQRVPSGVYRRWSLPCYR